MAILRPTPVPTNLFTVSRDGRGLILAACLSDLTRYPFGRVFDDACDEGFTLVSHNTGTEIVCAVSAEVRDADRDLVCVELKPVTPGAPDFTVRLFND